MAFFIANLTGAFKGKWIPLVVEKGTWSLPRLEGAADGTGEGKGVCIGPLLLMLPYIQSSKKLPGALLCRFRIVDEEDGRMTTDVG